MILSTLRAPISWDSLTDDSVLVILGYLSVPQLMTFLSVSRRLNSLIVQYTLPSYRTIHLPNLPANILEIAKFQLLKPSIFFSRRYYSHRTFYLPATSDFEYWTQEPSHFRSLPLFRSQLISFPHDLSRLLWRLQCLTFSYFLGDKCLLSDEEKLINQCLTVYLRSSWSETLVSLKLYFVDITDSSSTGENNCLFAQLNNFHSLKHLFLHFIPNGCSDRTHLPDSLPVLSQLHSFSLQWYEGSNTVTLLHQLGPHLVLLSLYHTNCPFQDVLNFLSSKLSYRKTLTTLEFHSLCSIRGSQWSTLTSSFPALVHFASFYIFKSESLFTFFTLLGRLSQLREILDFTLSIEGLRALRDACPLHRLPTLPSIRRLGLNIEYSQTERLDLQASEFFNDHLPLLGAIFCAAENVDVKILLHSTNIESVPLSKKLADKVREHFPSVRTCQAHGSQFGSYVRAY